MALADSTKPGYLLEFGVGGGRSLSWLSKIKDGRRLFGFDSFEGLPEDWCMNSELTEPAGAFKYDPPTHKRAELCIGWFEYTIPAWKEEHPGRISFLHIDSDLYSSCKTILTMLNDRICPQTIIVIDDMYGTETYRNWEQGEYKAFNEWIETQNRKIYELGRGDTGEVSFRVLQ